MPAVAGSSPHGQLIVTPDMVPPNARHWDAQVETYRAGATSWDEVHQQIVRDNVAFREAADSPGFDEAHRAGAILAEEIRAIAEWHIKAAEKYAAIATVLRDTRSGQEQLVREADAKIADAKLPGEVQALVTQYHEIAMYQTEAGVTAAMASHAAFKKSPENVRAMDLLTRWGDVPTAPSVQPVDHQTSPGIEQGNDPWNTSRENGSDEKRPAEAPTDPTTGASTTQPGAGPGTKTAAGDKVIKAAAGPITQPPPGVPPPPAATAALGGGGMPSMGAMGGGGGMGGSLPKMPAGPGSGGAPGLGSNPLSGGMGQIPGGASGSPNAAGLPGSSGAGPGSPLSAFTQGMSASGGVRSVPPAPASPSPALSAGGHAASGAPVSAAPGGGGSPVVAQPGTVAPTVPVSGSSVGLGGGAPIMLPPGSMGPPAGPVAPPPITVSAGTLGSTNSSMAPVLPPPNPAAGATLIPASVVTAGQTAAARERSESPDTATAKQLAWKLQHAAQAVGYPIEWAVGVFRSPSGTETVVTSNDGASYVPAGVFVPRSIRVLATDPLVDDHFRQLWFGWSDPSRSLVEYARLRAELGWRLVAAATTVGVSALRDAGVEHAPSCTRQTNPLLQPGCQAPAPVLDAMHVHRLAGLWPEVYPRLLRVMDTDPMLQDRIVSRVSVSLVNSSTTQAQAVDGGIPDAVRAIWLTRGGDREPSPQQWAEYDAAAKDFNTVTTLFRPGFLAQSDPMDTVEELRRYRAHWMVARTAELIGGWATRPLPLPDMCYAAAATGGGDLREVIVKELASVEEDLGEI